MENIMVHIDDDWLLPPPDSIAHAGPPDEPLQSGILSTKMGSTVFEHLSAMQDLSGCAEGIIAGQSVASALYDLFGLGAGSVYNDIDVFVPYRGDGSDLKNMPDYPEEGGAYVILKTENVGIQNFVHCDQDSLSAMALLSAFDLNCVQVGVVIETKELIWTDDFDLFCQTKSIEPINLSTPFHSMIRFALKRLSLKESVANEERVFEVFFMAISLCVSLGYPEPPLFKQEFFNKQYLRAIREFPLLNRYVAAEEAVKPIVQYDNDEFLPILDSKTENNNNEVMYCLKPAADAIPLSRFIDYACCKRLPEIAGIALKIDRSAFVCDSMYSF